VRRIGYESASFTAVLKPGRTHRATLTLTASAQPLPTVSVADTATQTHWLDQFDRRRSSNRGTFITRQEIVRAGARSGTDIVRTVPGVRLVPMRRGIGYQVVMTRGSGARQCLPSRFVAQRARIELLNAEARRRRVAENCSGRGVDPQRAGILWGLPLL
jgi:hypothetical protein